MKNKKMLLILGLIFILFVIAITVFLLVINKKKPVTNKEEEIDLERLYIGFEELFSNKGNEYIATQYSIQEEEVGKYKIEANIPYVKGEEEISIDINKEINEIFITKLINVYNQSQSYTKLNIDYASSIDGNILSLAVKCVLKEKNNAQRIIIKTYNYDLESKQKLEIIELIPEDKRSIVQEKINKKIDSQIRREEAIIAQGYNTYRRQKDSEIYNLENATEFYVKDKILYIIYSYGNNNYTSEIDLIITSIT